MKQFFIVFLILTSFVSARAAELGCLCFEDTISHSASKSTSVQSVDHHNDAQSSEDKDHSDHCQHTCSQCHFAALVPLKMTIASPESITYSEPSSVIQFPKEVSSSVYRPPIS